MIFRRKQSPDGTVDAAGYYPAEPGYEPPYEPGPYEPSPYETNPYAQARYAGQPGQSVGGPPVGGQPGQPGQYEERYEHDPDGAYVLYADVAPHLAELEGLRGERRALIELCLYARDRVNSSAAADRIDAGLAELGITMLRPDGRPFDPAQHEAAASVPTDDPARHGTVAETEVPGYADRGVVVRPPVVSVYRREGS
jgi:molecular chaperone GrpE